MDGFTREMRQQRKARAVCRAVFVRLQFDCYYLPEDIAPAVEREYAEASRKAQANTYVQVRVRDGHAALAGLVLDGKAVGAK